MSDHEGPDAVTQPIPVPPSLAQKFPDLEPMGRMPVLVRVNGFGASLYGRRDHDLETGTYVATHCLSALFIPVFALRSYRVSNSSHGGWFFLGREPLSAFAKAWNLLAVCILFAGAVSAAWCWHGVSPAHAARLEMQRARELLGSGRVPAAVQSYSVVASGETAEAGEARAALINTVLGRLPELGLEDALAVATNAIRAGPVARLELTEAGMHRTALPVIERSRAGDPRGALRLLDALAPFTPAGEDATPLREELIRECLAREPGDAELVSDLALILERRGDLEGCESALAPVREKLGELEGARILGRIYAAKDRIEEAQAVLSPYVEGRLKRMQAIEKDYHESFAAAVAQVVKELRGGRAPGFDYGRHRSAAEEEQNAQVAAYIGERMAGDPLIQSKLDGLKAACEVVPVALDLGILRLRRAQSLADLPARQRELKSAEETFLAIRGQAGESDAFRIFYGQVCYWLGKQKEGAKQFEDLLQAHQRAGDMLIRVSQALRGVGDEAQARELAEEAHAKETDPRKKHEAARFRALIPLDLDDEIRWLRLADAGDAETFASLQLSLGRKAAQEGRTREAIACFRKAIAGYARLPKSSSTLNNGALAQAMLFSMTGNRADFTKSARMMEEAVALQPDNSILLANAAQRLMESAVLDLAGESIDFRMLEEPGSLNTLRLFYADQEGHRALFERLGSNAGFRRAVSLYEKVTVLAPRSPTAFAQLWLAHGCARSEAPLLELSIRLQGAQLDLSELNRSQLEQHSGKKDALLKTRYAADTEKREKALRRLPREVRPLDLAAAACSWIESAVNGWGVGLPSEPDRLVEAGERAHAARPSARTRAALLAALCLRLKTRFETRDEAFAEMGARLARSLSPRYLVAAGIWRSGPLAAAFLADPDGKRALELIRENLDAFPERADEQDWAILKAVDPPRAAAAAEVIRKDRVGRLSRRLFLDLYPLDSRAALDGYWALEAEGRQADAKELLRAAAGRGVPLPFQP